MVLPPLLGALHDTVRSWSTVWAVACGAVLAAMTMLALGPRVSVSVRSGEGAVPLGPAVADVARGATSPTG